MDSLLRAAFGAAHYRFRTAEGELLLRVGVHSPALARWMVTQGVQHAAVLTAFNPRGKLREAPLNQAAQAQLRTHLQAHHLLHLPGSNEDPQGHWPAEESFLIAGLSQAEAAALARRHDQAAFLWADQRAVPELVETRP